MTKQNSFPYWGFFNKREIEKNKGKLLMLDIDFGRYCSLNCPTCFRKSNVIDEGLEGDLTYGEILGVIGEAKELGLQSVKICGAGEPTENTNFLNFIREMDSREIGVAVFTKGQVLGSDEKTKFFNSKYGIETAKDLCEELFSYKVSFMLSFQSFDSVIQDELVGKTGHSKIRDRALENLIDAGFNSSSPTRLSICNAPITQRTVGDAFDIYVFARKRNLYPVFAMSMVSGRQFNSEFLKNIDLSYEEKVGMYTKIYSWNIDHGIQTLEQIQEEGISSMPGAHPCNQVAAGLYITAKGNVVGCPGFNAIEGNVRRQSIKEVWENSKNKKCYSGKFNCECPPKAGSTVPSRLYHDVLKKLKEKYS